MYFRDDDHDPHTNRDAAFADQWQITSITGRLYTRSMVLATATRLSLFKPLGVTRSAIATVLDDPAWMRLHRGEIPARVAEDALYEAFRRKQT